MKQLLLLLLFTACNGGGGGSSPSSGIASAPTTDTSIPDPLAEFLWQFKNTGQKNFTQTSGTIGEDINLSDVHEQYQGQGVYIAISDGRIDLEHEDIKDNSNILSSLDFLHGTLFVNGSPTASVDNSHGTTVAGLIGAVKGNGKGGYGIAPKSKLVGSNYLAGTQSLARYKEQLYFGSARIYNYSYGFSTCDVNPYSTYSLSYLERYTLIYNNIYITSAGNDYIGQASECGGTGQYYGNGNLDQSKSYPYFIVVGASNPWGISSSYSTPSSNIWITAPGGDVGQRGVVSTDLEGCDKGSATSSSINDFDKNANGLNTNCSYVAGSSAGTSFAAPIVAGAVGLLRQIDSGLTWREVKHILAKTAKKIDPTNSKWIQNAAGYAFNEDLGFGQLNVKAAVLYTQNQNYDLGKLINTKTFNGYSSYSSGNINLAIPVNSLTGVSSVINVSRHDMILEHIQLRVSINHAYAQDMNISLTSPSGTKIFAMKHNSKIVTSNLVDVTFGMNAFYGESSKGNWTLTIKDQVAQDSGTLVKWELNLLGHKDPVKENVPPLISTGLTRNGNSWTWSNASTDIARYEICVKQKYSISNICEENEWADVGSATSLTVTHEVAGYAILGGNRTYVFGVRAIDAAENRSEELLSSWSPL